MLEPTLLFFIKNFQHTVFVSNQESRKELSENLKDPYAIENFFLLRILFSMKFFFETDTIFEIAIQALKFVDI